MSPSPAAFSTQRRWVLLGDGQSPHLLKWAQALEASGRVELWVASSRGFLDDFDAVVPGERRLALGHDPRQAGGNVSVLRHLPRLARWLAAAKPDVLHAHYLTSHGTLAWLARALWRLDASLVSSAWGSDILVAPRNRMVRWVTRRVLKASILATSDSHVMAAAMRSLGAGEVMTFPFGLPALPPLSSSVERQPWLVYASRGLEPIYRPDRVLDLFEALALRQPEARLVVANDGSLRASLQARCEANGSTLKGRVRFVGRLGATAQAEWYRRAALFFSLPSSDSVSVSVIEAMAYGALPVLSDLPANRELVRHGETGLLAPETPLDDNWWMQLQALHDRPQHALEANRRWVAEQALFPQSVSRFLDRAEAVLPPAQGRRAESRTGAAAFEADA